MLCYNCNNPNFFWTKKLEITKICNQQNQTVTLSTDKFNTASSTVGIKLARKF